MKKLLFILILGWGSQAMAHGSLELIECHNKDNSMIFSGEAINKQNVFKIKALKAGKTVWEKSNVKLALTDTVENNQVIENIKLETKEGKAHLKVFEVATREIRNGTGTFEFSKFKSSGPLSCYAVY